MPLSLLTEAMDGFIIPHDTMAARMMCFPSFVLHVMAPCFAREVDGVQEQ
jgi:hypothetical protein